MSGAAQDEAARPRAGPPPGSLAFGLAIAALAASWNPLAASLGMLVGMGALVLAVRARRRAQGRRGLATAAAGLALLAAVASATVLVLTAEAVSPDLPGKAVVESRPQADLDRLLDEAGQRTRGERERAAKELERLVGRGAGAPKGGRQDQR